MNTRPVEMIRIARLLGRLGFNLEAEQPHVKGERFLASPDKLVLVGRRIKDNLRVIIKMSRLKRAKVEIRREKKIRDILSSIVVIRKTIYLPREIYYGKVGLYQLFITKFISQERVFLSYPLKFQLMTLIKSFQGREGLNGKTFKQIQDIYKDFPLFKARNYLTNFKDFQTSILAHYHTPGIEEALAEGLKCLQENKTLIGKYCNYLVHTDFAPHNFRITKNHLYTLDCSAFQFGHKYEEMARLLNYMVIHNPALEKRLKSYVLRRRGQEEYLSLKLLRIYKIVFLLKFYTQSLAKTSDDLRALTIHRIEFWEEVLRSVIQDREVNEKILKVYLANRDHLRSDEEKIRQREFAKA